MINTFSTLAMPHIRGLLAAIDAGDDTALPILADALEEKGDSRAAGLRRLPDAKESGSCPELAPFGLLGDGYWGWSRHGSMGADRSRHWPHAVRIAVFDRLRGGQLRAHLRLRERIYPTRSAAYLALAAALAEE